MFEQGQPWFAEADRFRAIIEGANLDPLFPERLPEHLLEQRMYRLHESLPTTLDLCSRHMSAMHSEQTSMIPFVRSVLMTDASLWTKEAQLQAQRVEGWFKRHGELCKEHAPSRDSFLSTVTRWCNEFVRLQGLSF